MVDVSSVAFNPGATNLQKVSGSLYVPKQFSPGNVGGIGFFENEIRNSVSETVYYVDCWDSYHVLAGETHCGTIVKRKIPTWKWLDEINN